MYSALEYTATLLLLVGALPMGNAEYVVRKGASVLAPAGAVSNVPGRKRVRICLPDFRTPGKARHHRASNYPDASANPPRPCRSQQR
jgi:hypothetical protein